MTPGKTDFPPLLIKGLHPLGISGIEALTVARFPESARRPMLFSNLQIYLDKLAATGIKARVWLDGSYLTEKPEPDDIDLVVVFERESVRTMTAEAQQMLGILLNMNMMDSRFRLHVFKAPSDRQADLDYWLGLFGTLRDEVTPKGIAELRVNL